MLENEGLRSFVKPQVSEYGMWGHNSFILHGLYIPHEQLEEARTILANEQPVKEPRS